MRKSNDIINNELFHFKAQCLILVLKLPLMLEYPQTYKKNPHHRNLKCHRSQISKGIIKHIHKILDPLIVDQFYDWNCHPLKFEIKEMYITKNRVF